MAPAGTARPHPLPAPPPRRPAHLAILQGHDPRILGAAHDVVVPRDALQCPRPKPLQAVPLGGCGNRRRVRAQGSREALGGGPTAAPGCPACPDFPGASRPQPGGSINLEAGTPPTREVLLTTVALGRTAELLRRARPGLSLPLPRARVALPVPLSAENKCVPWVALAIPILGGPFLTVLYRTGRPAVTLGPWSLGGTCPRPAQSKRPHRHDLSGWHMERPASEQGCRAPVLS